MKNFLLYGPPASGKSTIAKKVCSELDLEYISIGEITRTEIENNSDLGKELKKYLDLIVEYPVELITEVAISAIKRCVDSGKSFILDGYPKYDWEAKEFLKQKDKNGNIDIAGSIILEIPFEVARSRAENRRICPSCQGSESEGGKCPVCSIDLVSRIDDDEIAFARRYNDYIVSIAETLDVLRSEKIPEFKIDSIANIEQVLESTRSLVSRELNAWVAQQREQPLRLR